MKDYMTYKGYIGSVRYSEDDEVFYGKLEGIDALITYEGQSVIELKKAFHEAVDDYIEHSRARGREPKKPFKGSFNIRIGAELHRKAVVAASKKGVSLNKLVQEAIEHEIAHAH